MISVVNRVVLLGGSGWIGREITSKSEHVISTNEIRNLINTRSRQDIIDYLRDEINADTKTVVINTIGTKNGNARELLRANYYIPSLISDALRGTSSYLIHIGSASEFGTVQNRLISDDEGLNPQSLYGVSKVLGSLSLSDYKNRIILRPFNLVDKFLVPGHVLLDLRNRTEISCKTGKKIILQNPLTTRAYVTKRFLLKSIEFCIDARPTGTYNICSDNLISYGELCLRMAKLLGFKNKKVDFSTADSTDYCVGNPNKWTLTSGLTERIQHDDLAKIILESTPIEKC